jgi:microtubule-associated protein, RP/EB family
VGERRSCREAMERAKRRESGEGAALRGRRVWAPVLLALMRDVACVRLARSVADGRPEAGEARRQKEKKTNAATETAETDGALPRPNLLYKNNRPPPAPSPASSWTPCTRAASTWPRCVWAGFCDVWVFGRRMCERQGESRPLSLHPSIHSIPIPSPLPNPNKKQHKTKTKKVDFNARSEVDCIANYKVLQAALDAAGITKPVDVARLVQARPADNLAFMQWCKAHFDGVTGGAPLEAWCRGGGRGGYDPAGRRAGSKTGDVKGAGGGSGKGQNRAPVRPAGRVSGGAAAAGPRRPLEPVAAARPAPAVVVAAPAPAREEEEEAAAAAAPQPRPQPSTSTDTAALLAEAAEAERDFYFSKLRAVELLVTGAPGVVGSAAAGLVARILYAPDEAGAAAVLAEAGAPTGEGGAGGEGGEGGEGGGGGGVEEGAEGAGPPADEPASPPRSAPAPERGGLPPSPLVEGAGGPRGGGRASVEAAMAGLAVSPPPARRR